MKSSSSTYHVPHHMNRDEPYRSVEQRRMKGCTCYTTYTKSVQGICKILFLFFDFLVFVVIGASPYHLPVFILDYETWPFHMVMMLSIVSWLLVIVGLSFFVSGYHLNKPHIAWPTREFIFNCIILVMVILAACLEMANVWRWDMANARDGVGTAGDYILRYGPFSGGLGMGAAMGGGSYGGAGYGIGPGSQYCGIDPRFCDAYFRLLLGYNAYLSNHVFACVLLVLVSVVQLISSIFSYKTWRRFKRDMSRGGLEPEPKLSFFTRVRYHFWNAKTTSANALRDSSSAIKDKISQMASKENLDEVDGSCVVDMSGADVTTFKSPGGGANSVKSSRSRNTTSGIHSISTEVYGDDKRVSEETSMRSSKKSEIYKSEKSIRSERTERSERSERSERTERSERSERSGRTERSERSERSRRTDRSDRTDRSGRGDKYSVPCSSDEPSYRTERSSRSSNHRSSSHDERKKRSSRRREDRISEGSEPETPREKQPESPAPISAQMASFMV